MAEGARIYQRSRTPVNVPLVAPASPRDLLQVARPEGVEPPTRGLEGRCSIQLSYGRRDPQRYLSRGREGAPSEKKLG